MPTQKITPQPFAVEIPELGIYYSETQDPLFLILVHLKSELDPNVFDIVLATAPSADVLIQNIHHTNRDIEQILGVIMLQEQLMNLWGMVNGVAFDKDDSRQ